MDIKKIDLEHIYSARDNDPIAGLFVNLVRNGRNESETLFEIWEDGDELVAKFYVGKDRNETIDVSLAELKVKLSEIS